MNLLNKVHCMDCFELLAMVPDGTVDLILSDPPYEQEAHQRGDLNSKRTIYAEMSAYTNLTNDWYRPDILELMIKKCKYPNLFLFGDKRSLHNARTFAVDNGLHFHDLPICKTQPVPFTSNTWLPSEGAIHITDRKIVKCTDYKMKIPYFLYNNTQCKETDHPNEKNLDMIMRIVTNLTDKGETILDCFFGSGTTGVACQKLGRNFISCDINQKYVDMANKRLSQTELFAGL